MRIDFIINVQFDSQLSPRENIHTTVNEANFEWFLNNRIVFNGKLVSVAKWVECSPMDLEAGFQFPVESYQRTQNIVLNDVMLNNQHYKVMQKGKGE